MKTPLCNKTLLALALALATVVSIGQAQDQPMPPPTSDAPLPPEIAPNTPVAQVIKLVQAGVDVDLILNFVTNSSGAFDLDADKIIALNDAGVPKSVVNAMLSRDKAEYAAANLPPPAPAPPSVTPAPPDTTTDTAPPAAPVTVNYFENTLSPYGSWVVVEGYGRCWRPTTVIYDSGWRPYCDRGHWVYTDCGWYWDSDYSWGVTFHYGRWFRDTRFGWCWYPDTEWGPSWVTWRSSGDYCGWAPLPPLAVYRPGAGFFYRGASVSVNFDFGLRADCFSFVAPDHFLEQHPRRFCVEPQRVPDVFVHSTVINNFNHRDQFVVNNGISVDQVGARAHRSIRPVQVGSLPDASRQGWRGGDEGRSGNHGPVGNNNTPGNTPGRNAFNGNNQPNHGPDVHDNGNNNAGHNNNRGSQDFGAGAQIHPGNSGNQPVGSPFLAPRQQTVENQNNHNGNGQPNRNNPNANSQTPGAGQSHPNNNGGNGALIIHGNGSGSPAGGNGQQHSQGGLPAVSVVTPAQPPVQQQSQSWQHQYSGGGQQHFNTAPNVPVYQGQNHSSAAPDGQSQQHFTAPVIPEHSAPQVEQHQYSAPSHVESVQHSAPPAAAPAPSQNESHNQDRGSDNQNQKDNQKNH